MAPPFFFNFSRGLWNKKELESAGADRVSVGRPIPPGKFREMVLRAHPDSNGRSVDSKDSIKSIAE